jgi:hypothetical protein
VNDNETGISSEWLDWYRLSPQERWFENGRLWQTFFLLGGSLEPEPDMDSPFFDAEARRPLPADGRSGLRVLRSCGV